MSNSLTSFFVVDINILIGDLSIGLLGEIIDETDRVMAVVFLAKLIPWIDLNHVCGITPININFWMAFD